MYDYQFSHAGLTSWVLLRHTWSVMANASAAKLHQAGLTPEQFDILWACQAHPGPFTPAEISRVLYRRTQSVAGILSRMEKEGLVTRIPKRKGHPFTEIKITTKGEKAFAQGIDIVKDLLPRITSSLSEEEHQQLQNLLRAMLHKAAEQLQLEIKPPPGLSEGESIPVEL